MLAVGLLKRGFDVKVFEKNITAIRGEGKYRGPIQVGIGQRLLSVLGGPQATATVFDISSALSAGAEQRFSCS